MSSPIDLLPPDVYDNLVENGWTVTAHEVDGAEALDFDHPLSMSFGFGLRSNADDSERVRHFLSRREFEVIQDRPQTMPHEAFLGSLRKMAGSMKWPAHVVPTVARLLGTHELVTEQEADWLESAGAAWGE